MILYNIITYYEHFFFLCYECTTFLFELLSNVQRTLKTLSYWILFLYNDVLCQFHDNDIYNVLNIALWKKKHMNIN